jgi:hypothetical protein
MYRSLPYYLKITTYFGERREYIWHTFKSKRSQNKLALMSDCHTVHSQFSSVKEGLNTVGTTHSASRINGTGRIFQCVFLRFYDQYSLSVAS